MQILVIASDNLVYANNLTNAITGDLVNNATLTGKLLLLDATIATFTMDFTGTDGQYRGLIPYTISLLTTEYAVQITASVGGFQRIFTKLIPAGISE